MLTETEERELTETFTKLVKDVTAALLFQLLERAPSRADRDVQNQLHLLLANEAKKKHKLSSNSAKHYTTIFMNQIGQHQLAHLIDKYRAADSLKCLRLDTAKAYHEIARIKQELWDEHTQIHIEPLLNMLTEQCIENDSSFSYWKFIALLDFLTAPKESNPELNYLFCTPEDKVFVMGRRKALLDESAYGFLPCTMLNKRADSNVANILFSSTLIQNALANYQSTHASTPPTESDSEFTAKILETFQYRHIILSYDEYIKKFTAYIQIRTSNLSAFVFEQLYSQDLVELPAEQRENLSRRISQGTLQTLRDITSWQQWLIETKRLIMHPDVQEIQLHRFLMHKVMCFVIEHINNRHHSSPLIESLIDLVIRQEGHIDIMQQGKTALSEAWRIGDKPLCLKLLMLNANIMSAALLLDNDYEKVLDDMMNFVLSQTNPQLNAMVYIQLSETKCPLSKRDVYLFKLSALIDVDTKMPSTISGGLGFTTPLICAALSANIHHCTRFIHQGAAPQGVHEIISCFPFYKAPKDRLDTLTAVTRAYLTQASCRLTGKKKKADSTEINPHPPKQQKF